MRVLHRRHGHVLVRVDVDRFRRRFYVAAMKDLARDRDPVFVDEPDVGIRLRKRIRRIN